MLRPHSTDPAPQTRPETAVPAQARKDSRATQIPERPALAPNVQLAGEMPETGFTDSQWLIVRDGKFVQVTELLYRVAEQANGERDLAQIAAAVTEASEWQLTADHVRQLLAKLVPLGIIAAETGAEAIASHTVTGPASPLRLNFRTRVIGPRFINPVTGALQFLYAPPVLVAALGLITLGHAWLYGSHGVMPAFQDMLYRPWTLFLVVGLMIMAGLFHELGHATALRYGGGQVRGMGVGLYLIYPAFFTDVTDSYRLGRWARVRTDLGGFYFYLIFTLAIMGLYLVTRQEFLLLTILLINFDILYQLLPFVRLDGYWALADLTGIPDFLSQAGPFLASILPLPAWKGSRLPRLKPWVRRVFTLYLVLTLPVLGMLWVLMLRRLPSFLKASGSSLLDQGRLFAISLRAGDYLSATLLALNLLIIGLIALGSIYLAYRLIRLPLGALWQWSSVSTARRPVAALATVATLGYMAWLWSPHMPQWSRTAPEGVQSYAVAERTHVNYPVAYPQHPPVGGNHWPVWQNCGYYASPIADENAVHSMEHGAVWITYRPDLPERQVEVLRRLARSQTYVLVSPYDDLPSPVVASAWGHQLQLDSAGDLRLEQFVNYYRLAPTAPEAGETCTGGVGTPE